MANFVIKNGYYVTQFLGGWTPKDQCTWRVLNTLDVFKKHFKRFPGMLNWRNLYNNIITDDESFERMVQNILNDPYAPSQCSFDAEHVNSLWYYPEWGAKPTKKPVTVIFPLPCQIIKMSKVMPV